MTKFFDPLSGETRELNYHGIKCRREPEPLLDELAEEHARSYVGNKDYTAGCFCDSDIRPGRVDKDGYYHGDYGTAPSFIFGNIWSKPMNRTQELPALLQGFDIRSDDTVHIGFNAPAVPVPGYTPPKLTDPNVIAYGWRHGIFYVQLKSGMHSFTEPFFNLYYEDEETAYSPFAAVAR